MFVNTIFSNNRVCTTQLGINVPSLHMTGGVQTSRGPAHRLCCIYIYICGNVISDKQGLRCFNSVIIYVWVTFFKNFFQKSCSTASYIHVSPKINKYFLYI